MGFGKGDGIVYSHAAMLAYYRQGLSDPEIARKVGCTASNVYKWRKFNGLEPNVPAHGYGRPPKWREAPPPPPEPEPRIEAKEIRLRTECPSCTFCASLNHGTADTYCAYCLITGHARILLPERADGICPGFETGVPDRTKSAEEDAESAPHPPAEPAPSPRGEGTGGDGP